MSSPAKTQATQAKSAWPTSQSRVSPSEFVGQFDPTPSQHVMPKVQFFFKPYNHTLGYAKHMEFEDSNDNAQLKVQIKQ